MLSELGILAALETFGAGLCRKAVQAEEEALAGEKPEMAGLDEGKMPVKKELSRSASSKVRRALEEVLDPNTQSLGDDDLELSDAKEIYKQVSSQQAKQSRTLHYRS